MALVRDALRDLTSGIRWRALVAASVLTLIAIGVLTATDAPPATVSLVLGGAAAVIALCLVGDGLVTDAVRQEATVEDVPAIVESDPAPSMETVAEARAGLERARSDLARYAAELAEAHELKRQSELATGAPSLDLKLALGANVRRLRRARRWSQEMLAHFAGLHPTEVSRLERGEREPRLRTIMQVAAALQVPVQELIAPPASVEEPVEPVSPEER
jgi:DNA-binding XRE family transcriptional regulator